MTINCDPGFLSTNVVVMLVMTAQEFVTRDQVKVMKFCYKSNWLT